MPLSDSINISTEYSEKLEREVNELKEDFRAEVLVANWLEEGRRVPIVVQPKGLFARDFGRDILKGYYESVSKIFYLELNREGLYDTLPEGFFHQPGIGQTRSRERTADMVSHSRQQRKEEQHARRFFQPLEQAFYRQRVALELSERRALAGFVNPEFQDEFAEFWDLPLDTPRDQLARICYLLPLVHRVVGNPVETVRFLEIVLQESVRWVDCEENEPEMKGENQLPGLGVCNLGLDFILGQKSSAVFPTILIRIGPVSDERIKAFLPGNLQRRVLDTLFSYLMPVGYTVKTQILPERDVPSRDNGLFLGYNTTI